MSTNVAKTIPIGPCEIYWNDVRLGSPKSAATIRYNKETVQAGLEDSGMNEISHKTKETCEVDVVIADLKLSQMRYALDQVADFANQSTISTAAYDASTSTVFRFKENHKLSGTDAITVDQASFDTSTIMVFKSDYSNTPDGYTKGTDYTATAAAGTVARLAGGSITDGETVIIEYNEAATATRLGAGGLMADFEAALRIVHTLNDGKKLQFYGYRAKKIGASEVAIQMAAEFGGIPATFHLLADLSKTPGKQLFYWAQET